MKDGDLTGTDPALWPKCTNADHALYRDQRNRAWASLYQIKKAMPMLRQLLDVLPMSEATIVGNDVTGEASWDIGGAAKSIQLAALVGATLDVINEGLPEEYTDEEGPDPGSPVPDPGTIGNPL